MTIKPLDKAKYTDFPLTYSYTTSEHYHVIMTDSHDEMAYRLVREPYDEPREEVNTDTLYQDYWTDAEAYAVYEDGTDRVLGYLEIAFEEWNNRLLMTQLLVLPESRGKGVGKFLVDFVKSIARERDYRVISLEAQNYNTPAIDFYRSQGFVFSGGNVYFYSNVDIEDDEVMLEMAYLLD